MKPTDEQIKKVWKWCGFRLKELHSLKSDEPYFVLYEPNGEQYNLWIGHKSDYEIPIRKLYPLIDLNNLFKYAVPKLTDAQKARLPGHFSRRGSVFTMLAFEEDPALALFWAIWEVIKV